MVISAGTVKVKAVKIEILWSEHPDADTDRPTFTTFAETDWALKTWAHSAPSMGYDKTKFRITFADGETYEGRFDLQAKHVYSHFPLEDHIRDELTFFSGRKCPGHLTQEQYQECLSHYTPAELASCGAFLDTYQIGD